MVSFELYCEEPSQSRTDTALQLARPEGKCWDTQQLHNFLLLAPFRASPQQPRLDVHAGERFMSIRWWGPAAAECPPVLAQELKKNTPWETEQRLLCVQVVDAPTSLHINCGYVDVRPSAVNKTLLLLRWKSTLDLCMARVETPRVTSGCQSGILKVQSEFNL